MSFTSGDEEDEVVRLRRELAEKDKQIEVESVRAHATRPLARAADGDARVRPIFLIHV